MTLERLQKYLDEIIKRHPDYGKNKIVIPIVEANCCGGTPYVEIKDVATGFDWNSGNVFLIPEHKVQKLPEPSATVVKKKTLSMKKTRHDIKS